MQLNPRIGKFRNGVGIIPALRVAIHMSLTRWASSQLKLLKQAFDAGGHQLHGGDRWEPGKKLGRVLIGSGRLRNSIRTTVTQNKVLIRAGASYASYHQFGTETLPKRLVIVVTAQDKQTLVKDLKKDIERGINGSN